MWIPKWYYKPFSWVQFIRGKLFTVLNVTKFRCLKVLFPGQRLVILNYRYDGKIAYVLMHTDKKHDFYMPTPYGPEDILDQPVRWLLQTTGEIPEFKLKKVKKVGK